MVPNFKAHCHSLPSLQLFVRTEIVSGISIPERNVGIDGLLGRSFLKRFAVCFDFEQGSKIQLTPK